MHQFKYKIGLIVPYFGRFHNYFDLWLLSCKNNPNVDWIIFTDDRTCYNYPENVKVKYISFEELKIRIQSLFDFAISLETPYKLCDFRVAYGEIFQDELAEYDFWGYCDVDLIWGDVRKIWSDEILDNYDKISDAGHFTLYKNTEKMRIAYRTLPQQQCYYYKDVFSSRDPFAFDEWGKNKGINRILLNNGFTIKYKPILFSDIKVNTYGLFNTRATYDDEPYRSEEKEKKKIIFAYEDGKLYQYALGKNGNLIKHEEGYVHLQKRPMKRELPDKNVDRYIIYPPNIFMNYPNVIDKNYLKHINDKKIYWHYLEIRWNNLKRKLGF